MEKNRHKDHGFILIELNLAVVSVGMLTDSFIKRD